MGTHRRREFLRDGMTEALFLGSHGGAQEPLDPPCRRWLDLEGAAALIEGSFENLPLVCLGQDVFKQPVRYLLSILNGRLAKPKELTDLCPMSLHGASIPLEGGEALH